MLEAVNSVLQSAPLVRGHSEQVASSDSFAANPERVQRTAPQAPFVSPYIFMDVNFDKAVLQLRNGDTGDVVDQFPSEASLDAAARQAVQRELSRQQASASTGEGTTSPAPRTPENTGAAVTGNTGDAPQPQVKAETITPQQKAAFQAAAQTGNANAGHDAAVSRVEVLA